MKFFINQNLKRQFLPSALEIIETPASPIGKITIWLIFILLIICIGWSIISQVDEVAIAHGKLVPDGHIKVIQSLDGGVITAIYVEEGEHVIEGQLLMELDNDIGIAELDKNRLALETARMEQLFLNALLDKDDSKVDSLLNTMEERKLSSEVIKHHKMYQSYKERDFSEQQKAYGLSAQKNRDELNMAHQYVEQSQTRATIIKEELEIQAALFESGAVSEQVLKEKEQTYQLALQEVEVQKTKVAYYESQLNLSINQKTSHEMDYYKELLNELVAKDKEILQLENEVVKMEKKIQLQQIISPVDGIVQGVGANTIGGVVTSAKPIVSIVPAKTPLVIEANVMNKDIGFIDIGQETDIKLDTFPFQKYGTISGKIVHISPDAVENEQLGYVYKIKVKPDTDTIMIDSKKMNISSGMTVAVEVKTNKRRVIEFFLPAIEYVKDSFKLR